jgi:hypothetical protein
MMSIGSCSAGGGESAGAVAAAGAVGGAAGDGAAAGGAAAGGGGAAGAAADGGGAGGTAADGGAAASDSDCASAISAHARRDAAVLHARMQAIHLRVRTILILLTPAEITEPVGCGAERSSAPA